MGSLASKGYHVVPILDPKEPEVTRRLIESLNRVLQGKMNCTADMTLKRDAVSTTVSDVRCGVASVILPMPTSVDGEVALTSWRVSTRNNGSFVISHVSTSTSDATATYAIFG
jgi:hypothetical protein